MGISLKNVYYTYQEGSPFEGQALSDISLEIKDGSYTAIIGHTGSGKSTLLQLLKGLLRPTKGTIQFEDFVLDNHSEPKEMKYLRTKVGLVFQFPESQLFEETVLKDVAFGPQNFGISKAIAEELAREKLSLVGIEPEFFEKNPFELSGGQMRRVAIAGILAMEPKVLVLDEPTAGLDPEERLRFKNLISQHREDCTILISTHIVEDVEALCDHIIILSHGKSICQDTPENIRKAAMKHVWHVSEKRQKELTSPYYILRREQIDGEAYLRVLSNEEQPGKSIQPTLEDGYINIIRGIR